MLHLEPNPAEVNAAISNHMRATHGGTDPRAPTVVIYDPATGWHSWTGWDDNLRHTVPIGLNVLHPLGHGAICFIDDLAMMEIAAAEVDPNET